MKETGNSPKASGLSLDRRQLMKVGSASLAASALAPVAAWAGVPARRKLDPANPEDARKIVRKMRYRLDEGLLYWWIKGEYMADVDGRLTPLYAMNFASIQEVSQRPDGSFDIRQLELGFRTDLATGKPLKNLRNPFTGETVPVAFNPIGPTLVHYNQDSIPQVSRNLGGSEIEFSPEPETPVQIGNSMFLSYRAHSKVTTKGFPDRIVNDISMIYGPAHQALDPNTTSVDAWVHSSDITSFPRWLNMGEQRGSLTLRGIGAKAMKIGDLPQDYLALLEAYDASIIANPSAALRRPMATYKG